MRIVAHLDLDAFFASVEERERPYLTGAPIVVGADPEDGKGRGVVSTCNYKAREYGIRSAMPIREAWRRSEEAKRSGKPVAFFISPDFSKYTEASRAVFAIVEKHSKEIESAGIDEAYFDLSGLGSFEKAEAVAQIIKKEIQEGQKLTASIGIGPNKLIAKIASDFKKPDGLTIVKPEDVEKFLEPLPIRKIPGIGPKAEKKLFDVHVLNVADARGLTKEILQKMFGKWGTELYEKLRGRNEAPIVTIAPPAKSIGDHETLPEDSLDMNVLLPYLEHAVETVARRVSEDGFSGFRTIVLTVRFSDFETLSRSRTLPLPVQVSSKESRSGEPISGAKLLLRHATQLFLPFLDRRENPRQKKIRLIGVRVEKLSKQHMLEY